MKKARWLVINGLFLAAIIAGCIYGFNGFENIAIFFAGFLGVISFGANTEKMREETKPDIYSFPAWFDVSFGIVVTCIFVYHGHWFISVLYLIHIGNMAALRKHVMEKEARA